MVFQSKVEQLLQSGANTTKWGNTVYLATDNLSKWIPERPNFFYDCKEEEITHPTKDVFTSLLKFYHDEKPLHIISFVCVK